MKEQTIQNKLFKFIKEEIERRFSILTSSKDVIVIRGKLNKVINVQDSEDYWIRMREEINKSVREVIKEQF